MGELPLGPLFALDILLQIADGSLTHAGIGLRFLEGNPMLGWPGVVSILGEPSVRGW